MNKYNSKTMNFTKQFEEVYKKYYDLHPSWEGLPKSKYYYLHRQWFFPNHIDLVLENIRVLQSRYYPNADLKVAMLAGLLHDAGLVYKRTGASPDGHENRSCEYVKALLPQFGYTSEFIASVCEAIEATDSKVPPTTEESLLVRNADAYSHLTSIHFFAKAYFAEDVETYIEWFAKKIEGTLNKLTIKELIDETTPMVVSYRKMLQIYKNNQERPFTDRS